MFSVYWKREELAIANHSTFAPMHYEKDFCMLRICTAKCRCLCFSKGCLWEHECMSAHGLTQTTWIQGTEPLRRGWEERQIDATAFWLKIRNLGSYCYRQVAHGPSLLCCRRLSPKEPACMCWPRANEAVSWMLACVTGWSSPWGPELALAHLGAYNTH